MRILKVNVFLLAMGMFFFTSCKEESSDTNPVTGEAQTEAASKTGAGDLKNNPAHGLPGHRCDLPVGAPLTASAGTTPTPTPTTQLPSTSVSPIRVDQTPSVNPPHGEPGHDCSVPVGAEFDK
jgi:hypothetical protein